MEARRVFKSNLDFVSTLSFNIWMFALVSDLVLVVVASRHRTISLTRSKDHGWSCARWVSYCFYSNCVPPLNSIRASKRLKCLSYCPRCLVLTTWIIIRAQCSRDCDSQTETALFLKYVTAGVLIWVIICSRLGQMSNSNILSNLKLLKILHTYKVSLKNKF